MKKIFILLTFVSMFAFTSCGALSNMTPEQGYNVGYAIGDVIFN